MPLPSHRFPCERIPKTRTHWQSRYAKRPSQGTWGTPLPPPRLAPRRHSDIHTRSTREPGRTGGDLREDRRRRSRPHRPSGYGYSPRALRIRPARTGPKTSFARPALRIRIAPQRITRLPNMLDARARRPDVKRFLNTDRPREHGSTEGGNPRRTPQRTHRFPTCKGESKETENAPQPRTHARTERPSAMGPHTLISGILRARLSPA